MGGAGHGGGFRGEKMGFGRGVSWIPTLTRSFILSVRSRKWGNGESRLRVENERLDGVLVGESWESPGGGGGDSTCWAVGAGGDSSCWAVGAGGNSSCWGKDDDVKASLSVCCPSWSILISGGSNFSPEGCLICCFGLSRLLSLAGAAGD